jgi:hypothetical protein
MFHRQMHAGSPSPERGIRTFGDINPGSPFHGGHRYCHNGGMVFSRLYGGGLDRPRASRRPWGPRTPSRPPSRPPRKAPGCRVGPQTGEVLPERGHGLRSPIEASASQGSKMAMMAPVAVPRKVSICRGKGLGVHDPRPLGAWMDSSASRERSTATTGCRGDYGLRRIASSARSEEVAGR